MVFNSSLCFSSKTCQVSAWEWSQKTLGWGKFGILEFWGFGDSGALGVLDLWSFEGFGVWGFWIFGVLGFWIFGVLGILEFWGCCHHSVPWFGVSHWDLSQLHVPVKVTLQGCPHLEFVEMVFSSVVPQRNLSPTAVNSVNPPSPGLFQPNSCCATLDRGWGGNFLFSC